MDYYDRVKQLKELASYDNSGGYEVDTGGIYLDEKDSAKPFRLITASGCSCWDGDFTEDEFATLEDLEKSLNSDLPHRYNPSINTGKWLIEEAGRKLKESFEANK